MAILVNNEGEFYAGFNADRCAPIWRRSKASAVEIGHDILRAVTRQLKALGHPVDVYTVKARGKKAAKENRRAR